MANIEEMKTAEELTELRERIKSFRNKRKPSFHPVKPFNVKGIVKGVVFFLPLIYVVIYIIGFMKYVGFMDVYKLDSVEFPIPVDTAIFWGVLALVPGLKYWLWLQILLFAYLILLVLALFANKPRLRAINWLTKVVSKIPRPKKTSNGELATIKDIVSQVDSAFIYIIQSFLCFFIMFAPILIGYLSMQQGNEEANQHQQEFLSSKTYNIYESPQLLNPPYMRVVCNTTHCAFWNKDGTILLRHDQVQKIHFAPEKNEKKK